MACQATFDFFKHINHDWLNETTIPDEYSKWGVFELVYEKSLDKLKKLLETLGTNDQETLILNTLYKQYQSKNTIGLDQLSFYLNLIRFTNNKNELVSKMGYLYQRGIGNFIAVGVSQDFKNSNRNILYLYPSGLDLPDRDYYLEDKNKKYVTEYKKLLVDVLNHDNFTANTDKLATDIITFQTRLAKVKMPKAKSRNPENVYNKMELKDLEERYPNFPWKSYINSIYQGEIHELVVTDLDYFEEFNKLYEELDLYTIKAFLLFRLMKATFTFLNNDIEKLFFNFYEKVLSGKKKMKSQWKRLVEFLDDEAGELLSKIYVKKYFSEEQKNFMKKLIDNLMKAYENRLKHLEWMDDDTKQKALTKLSKFTVKVGFPDKFIDYTYVNISDNKNLVENVLTMRKFEFDNAFKDLYKEPDRLKWEMYAHQINAYYHPLKNEIVFPAGILQHPFFELDMSLPQLYGGIGAVIGHEITHGFDDQGRKFDGDGNMRNWWSENDIKKYSKISSKIVKQFNNFEIVGKNVNGELTQGENIADLGGLLISYDAMLLHLKDNNQKITLNLDKDFLNTWGKIWRCKIKDKEQEKRIMTDPHSPNVFRVNGPLRNLDLFHRAYNTKQGDGMYVPEKKRIRIW